MALLHLKLPLSFPFIPNRFIQHHSSKTFLFLHSKTPRLLSFCTAPPTSQSTSSASPIFLPYLQEDENDVVNDDNDDEQEDPEAVEEVELEDNDSEPEDPFIRFFKSRSSTQDPQLEGRLSFQTNRRSSWHLARDTEFVDDKEEAVTESDVEEELLGEKAELGSVSIDSEALSVGTVGEILQIARNLPQNLTLGESLGGFEGRVSEKECVEVLRLMGQEGLFMGCLYFFEWMGLQERSLVTPQAYSVLFALLGRAGMGDKLMVLFMNLPPKKEFRDVRVYNAAISGLMCSQRYQILVVNDVHSQSI